MAIELPGSKSIAARAMILDRVYDLGLDIQGLPDCDDTRELSAALRQLSASEGRPLRGAEDAPVYNLGSGGTSLRFFVALAASLPGFEGRVDCAEQLRARPLSPLLEALRKAGAEIECLGEEGKAPLYIKGKKLDGTDVRVDTGMSSQFSSALVLVSGLWEHPFEPAEGGVSRPYLDMSIRMRDEFRCKSRGEKYEVERDWSAASYFYEWRLLHPGRELEIPGLRPYGESLQGDSRCEEYFETARREGEVNINMEKTPDLVPAFAAGLCFAGKRFEITGIGSLRYKESDRLATLQEELGKAGYVLEIGEDSLAWRGKRKDRDPEARFDGHGDHRIVMALAAAGVPGEKISGKDCVSKSFPGFFEELEKLK